MPSRRKRQAEAEEARQRLQEAFASLQAAVPVGARAAEARNEKGSDATFHVETSSAGEAEPGDAAGGTFHVETSAEAAATVAEPFHVETSGQGPSSSEEETFHVETSAGGGSPPSAAENPESPERRRERHSTEGQRRARRAVAAERSGVPLSVPLERIQVREGFNVRSWLGEEQELEELADSIRRLGVLQPLLVSPAEAEGTYELVAGHRRFEAAKRAGLTHVPVVVRDLSEAERAAANVVENLQRSEVNPADEAEGFLRLMQEHGMSMTDVARLVGKSIAYVSNALRIYRNPVLRGYLRDGTITRGHAKVLAQVRDHVAVERLAEQVARARLSVARTRELLERPLREGPPVPPEDAAILQVRRALRAIEARLDRLTLTDKMWVRRRLSDLLRSLGAEAIPDLEEEEADDFPRGNTPRGGSPA